MPTQYRPNPIRLTADRVADHFIAEYADHAVHQHKASGSIPTFEQFLSEHLFVVGVTMTNAKLLSPFKGVGVPFNEFGKIYYEMTSRLLGNNLDRKRPRQPLMYAFIDFEGSRAKGKASLSLAANPHIHGLMLVRPETRNLFDPLHLPVFAAARAPGINIHITPFDSQRKPLDTVIDYAMKGYLETPTSFHGREDLWRIFPK